MIISRSHGFVFIKNRKVAGTSLEKYIMDNHFDYEIDSCTGSSVDNITPVNVPEGTKGHLSYDQIKQLYPNYDFSQYKFIIIERNPWDKVVSQYFFFRDQIKTISKDTPFIKFLKNPGLLPIDYNKYYNAPNLHVVKYETIDIMLEYYFTKIFNVAFDKEKFMSYNLKAGIRTDKHYSHMYAHGEEDIVAQHFANEIKRFDWEFEDVRK